MPTDRFGHFDADSYRAAQEEPTLQIGGLLYRGRLLSIEEWLVYAGEIEQLRAADARATLRRAENEDRFARDEELLPDIRGSASSAYVALYRRYLRAVFPRRRFRFWAPDPVAGLMAMPWGVVTEAITRFFDLQALATKPRESTPTSGTSSAPSTRDAPARPSSP